MKLLDTTVAIDHLRRVPRAVELVEELVEREGLAASELVRYELLAGARSDELETIESFCGALEWVPVSRRVVRVGGELARRFHASHSGIEDVDYLIAATALILDAKLVTTNVKHFPMFDGLEPAY